ncbi:hypothetical protein OLMES_3984 [Oleiphilus messinensis]|uniref:Lipoprotein n=1 Tax=Oleiphilus messinensis TaxID=141451 RepID=A0A1Y0IF51_9GAMM|nr:hypothetical protein [Oleiphilus messinensis]ARU58003.1 hypothetical protein OLMES_3984 [Oleiphilus messinensis]
MFKFATIVLLSLCIVACTEDKRESQLMPLFDDLVSKHEVVTIEFEHELKEFSERSVQEQEMGRLMMSGKLSDAQKEKMQLVISEGQAQLARMIDASNAVIESTTNIMSLMSSIYGMCGHHELRDKISSFITLLQTKYEEKKDIDTIYWNSLWAYEDDFKDLETDHECAEFLKSKDNIDNFISETIEKMSKVGA